MTRLAHGETLKIQRRGRRSLYALTVIGALALTSALIIPPVVLMNGGISETSVDRLSNIGQAYGVISAVLSAVALAALAASILYQARQYRVDQIIAWQNSQESLLRLAIEDPATFAPCIQDIDQFKDLEQVKRYYFATLWLSFSRTSAELGLFTDADLRDEIFRNMFRSPVATELWRIRRERILQTFGRLDGFWRVAEEEYQKSMSTRPASPEAGSAPEA
jgi:hypothetical protein